MWRWGVMEPSRNGRGHMQMLVRTHILIWLIDPQKSVSLYCSFYTWYLYYVIIYQLYHVGQVYLFFVSRLQHGENIYGCISINFGPVLLNKFILYELFDPLLVTSHWWEMTKWLCAICCAGVKVNIAPQFHLNSQSWAIQWDARAWVNNRYSCGQRFDYRKVTAASNHAFIHISCSYIT